MTNIKKIAPTGAQIAAIEAARKNVQVKTGTFAAFFSRKLREKKMEMEAEYRRPVSIEEVRARM